MSAKEVTKFRLFFAWQDEQEEAWLRGMAQSGWHLKAFGLPGFYRFSAGEPLDVAYRMDYQPGTVKDREYYLQLFADAGWEHVGQLASWEYFRKPVKTGEPDEIYTDPASKVQKYQRLMALMVIFLPIYMTLLTRRLDENALWIWEAAKLLMALLMIGYVIMMLALIRRISRLKKEQL